MTALSLTLPLKITAHEESFGIRDASGTHVAWLYWDDGDPVRRAASNRMTRAQAEEVAKEIARALTERSMSER